MSVTRMTTLLHFLIMSPKPIFISFSFLEYNCVTIRNILMILGRVIEQVNIECRYKNNNSAYIYFLIMSPDPSFLLYFRF